MAHSLGLIVSNRAVILGAVTVRELLDLARQGEASGAFDTIWVGDSLLAKPRLESVTLLSALAATTTWVRLGVGCMATFAHRHPVLLAQQWASLDVLSHGRSWLVVCLGGPNAAGAAQALEHAAMGIQARERMGRLEEGIVILRKLFDDDRAQPMSIQIYSMLFSWRHSIYLSMLGCLLLVTTSFAGTSEEMRRFDHNQDGKPNQWEYYRNGELLRVEVDRHHDGRVDEWTFYENGKTVRAKFDTTGNGQVNQWLFYNADDQVIRAEYDQQAKAVGVLHPWQQGAL